MSALDPKEKRLKFIPLRIAASLTSAFFLFTFCAGVLYDADYDYSPQDYLGPVWDNSGIVVAMFVGIFLVFIILVWSLFRLKWRLVVSGSIVILMICAGIFIAYQEGILEIYELGGRGEEVNLRSYEPFRENSLAKSLDDDSGLTLQSDLPRLDGATALYPLYASFARATYPQADYDAYDQDSSVIVCSRTAGAFANLLDGKADIAFLAGVSEEQRKQVDELGWELVLTPIGKEAFVFFVNKKNSISNLAVQDVVGIYSGRINNWSQVGGNNKEILAYQRPETSGSQVRLREIIGDTPIVEAPEKDVFDEMMGMYMAVAYKNHKNALGYSFLYYIRDMIAENKIKFLSIDGVQPTAQNITGGTYPFAQDIYAVTIARPVATDVEKTRSDNTRRFLDWILSPQGQSLVEKTGYVPLP